MIPKVCLNCQSHMRFADDVSNPVPGVCQNTAPWVFVQDMRTFGCTQRRALEEPIYVVPDDNEQPLASDQEVTNEVLESVPEGEQDAD